MALEGITANAVTEYGSLMMAGISLVLFLRFWKTSKEKDIYTIKTLSNFFAFYALFQLVLGAPILYSGLSQIQVTAFEIFAHISMFISLAYLSRIATYIHKPEWENYVFGGILAYGAIAMHLMFQQWNTIVPLIAPPALLVMVGLGTLVFYNMAKERSGVKRTKMILIGTGFLIIAISGPLHGAAQTSMQLAVVEAFTIIGTLAVAAGVYWKELISSE